MEPGDDPRLKRLLHEWEAPKTPDTLDQRVLGRAKPWWWILISSRVRIPLPVAIALFVALMWLSVLAVRDRVPVVALPGSTAGNDLRGFQPVTSVNVRIERSSDAIR
jgi:predicted CDP-diglyceride synthetase/phosphatidate cytidylyltransferase